MLHTQTIKRKTLLLVLVILMALVSIIYIGLFHLSPKRSNKMAELSDPQAFKNHWTYIPPAELRQPHDRFKAAFVTLTKGDRAALAKLRTTIRHLEDNFNKDIHYPYIIFSNEVLTDEFKELASVLASGDMVFYELESDMYGYGPDIDLEEAADARERMKEVVFGASEDYRFASRFMAGKIFEHPSLQDLDYYWRFEPDTEYICPMTEDPFLFMHENNKTLSFSISLYEYKETIPTLFDTVLAFAKEHPEWVQSDTKPGSLWNFVIDSETNTFNLCHFWSNFQIANLSFFRSEQYKKYFQYLDTAGGFFYERWGDPVVQTLAAVLFLEKQQIHHWETVGYRVADYFTHCPADKALYSKCSCRPSQNFDYDSYSCLRYFK